MKTINRICLGITLCLLVSGCASLKEKCVKIDIAEKGRVTAPSTTWFSVNLGTIEGPAKYESCPVEKG